MKKTLIFFIFYLFVITNSCCKKTDDLSYNFPIEFQYRVLDANNQVSATIKNGENFKISFLIINKSDTSWSLSARVFDGIDSFFQVNKIQPNQLNLNRPFSGIFCKDIDPVIRSRDTLKIEIPWVPDSTKRYSFLCNIKKDQKNLEKGSYSSSFSSTFNFTKGFTFEKASIRKYFKIDFLID